MPQKLMHFLYNKKGVQLNAFFCVLDKYYSPTFTSSTSNTRGEHGGIT